MAVMIPNKEFIDSVCELFNLDKDALYTDIKIHVPMNGVVQVTTTEHMRLCDGSG